MPALIKQRPVKNGGSRPAALKPSFRAALREDGALEIQIYAEIGADWYDGGVTAKTVSAKIEEAGNGYSRVRIRINSPGGDAFEGIAIYNIVRSLEKPVEVFVDGVAASAASIIAMCGDSITMGVNAMMMIHNASAFCFGFATDMRQCADALEKISGAIAQTYVTKTGKSAEQIASMMDAETWLTAQDCIDQGFATAIAGAADEGALALARSFRGLKRLKVLPENLRNADEAQCECECEACVDGDCAFCTNADCEDPNCIDCPMQESAENVSDLSLYEARARMLGRGQSSAARLLAGAAQ